MSGIRPFGLGIFEKVEVRVVEDRKVLESLLKHDAICISKLADYCRFHPLPAMYRILIWKTLLKIFPIHQQSHKFVMHQRREQFQDLHRCLKIMKSIDETTMLPLVCLKAYILENGGYELDMCVEEWHQLFLEVANCVCKITDDIVDTYWLSTGIYKCFSAYFKQSDDKEIELKGKFCEVLKMQDIKIYEHLCKTRAIDYLPYKKWFLWCYAGTLLPDGGLERIWDVVISGFFDILPFVAVQILLVYKRNLLHADTSDGILKVINDVPYPEETGEIIACKGVNMWQNYLAKNVQHTDCDN